jgi:SnoaL-like domain
LHSRKRPAVSTRDRTASLSVPRLGCCAHEVADESPKARQGPPRCRTSRGNPQIGRNWTRIFAAVPDIRARVLRIAVDGDTVWTEWEMSGTRRDGAAFLMRGVVSSACRGHRNVRPLLSRAGRGGQRRRQRGSWPRGWQFDPRRGRFGSDVMTLVMTGAIVELGSRALRVVCSGREAS